MKRREILSRLAAVLFYASIPLILPVAYAYYLGEEIAETMLITVCAMLLLSSPVIIPNSIKFILEWIKDSLKFVFKKEVPWNFAAKPMWEESPEMDFTSMKLGDMFALSALAWLIIPLITAYPYHMLGFTPMDSFFESMSGWTASGLSVVPVIESLPRSFVFFRSMTQWIGGLGFLVLMLLLFKNNEAKKLLKAEGKDQLEVGVTGTAKTYWAIYFLLTVFSIVLLFISGFDLFNSINLAMAGLANGGWFPFTVYSFTFLQKSILALTMVLGAISFIWYKRFFSGDFKVLLSEEFLLFFVIMFASIGMVYYVAGDEIYNTAFNLISGMATGGFSIGDLSLMHEFSKYIIVLLMIVGGMSCSTAGALKIWRIEIAVKTVLAKIKSTFLPPNTIQRVKVDKSCVDELGIIDVLTFIFLYFFVFLFASGMFMAWGWGVMDSFFLTASAMGNVGLSTLNLVPVSNVSKMLLTFLMYIGRMEIIPLIALLRFLIRRK